MNGMLDRLTFHLSYKRDPSRKFTRGGISGQDIENAYYQPGKEGSTKFSSGHWDHGDWLDEDATDDQILAISFRGAVNEAVHEALEWFRLDGDCLLDPHGEHETEIYERVNRLAGELLDLTKQAKS